MPRKLTSKELRERGLCIRCGKPNQDTKYASCPKCRAHQRDIRRYRIESGLCVKCGRPAEKGKTFCLVCLIDNREKSRYSRDRYETHIKQHKKEYNQKVYEQRIKDGICTMCGKRKPSQGYRICEICRKKKRVINKRSYAKRKLINPYIDRAEWTSYGICYRCGVNPTWNGTKLCKDCYDLLYTQICEANKLADRTYFREQNKLIRRRDAKKIARA